MKKHYLAALMLPIVALPLSVAARQLSPSEALSRLNSDTEARRLRSKINANPLLAVKARDDANFTGLYVFDTGDNGFAVVSADDAALPLLGYSDTQTFDAGNIPPQLEYWLQFYADEIAFAASHPAKSSAIRNAQERPDRAPISPMTVSKWNQGAPYNDDCPLDNGKRSVTGCVATAMAQGMYYCQWPAQGTGSHSYKWNDTQLSVDFGSTSYDWAAMTPTYDKESSEAAKEAVANLMYSCGVAVDMHYTSDESGASSLSIAPALYKYFGYDKSMAQPQRYFYGLIDWENMVYEQLSQGLIVLYGGQSYEGGHQFVCDGYSSDGYFHFNWGWGGMSDGYFLLSALDPMSQGIGGSADASGFNYDQGILINMKKAQPDSQVTPLIYCYGNFITTATDAVDLGGKVEFESSDGFFNFACTDIEGTIGVKVVASDGSTSYLTRIDGALNFEATSGIHSFDVKLPETLADGTYTVTPAFLPKDASEWIDVLCPLSGNQAITMTVADGQASFADKTLANIEVTNLTFDTPLYLDCDFQSTITFTNTGSEEYFGEYSFLLFDENGNQVGQSAELDAVDLQPGQSATVTYVSEFPAEYKTDSGTVTLQPGSYYLGIYSHFTNQQIYISQQPITIRSAPAETELNISALDVKDATVKDHEAHVTFSGNAACEEGYFAGRLTVAVFRQGAESTDMEGKSDYLFISEGNSSDFTADVTVTDVKSGDRFFAIVYYDGKEISNEFPFTLTETGITSVVDSADTATRYLNLDGIEVDGSNLAPGIYIRVQGNTASKILVR